MPLMCADFNFKVGERSNMTARMLSKSHPCVSSVAAGETRLISNEDIRRREAAQGFNQSRLSAGLNLPVEVTKIRLVSCLTALVCRHGNHKDTELTIRGSDGDTNHTHTHAR